MHAHVTKCVFSTYLYLSVCLFTYYLFIPNNVFLFSYIAMCILSLCSIWQTVNCPLWHTWDHCKIVFTKECMCNPAYNFRTMRLCALPAASTRTDTFSEQFIGCYWKDVSLCETLIGQHWVKRPSDGDWLLKVIFLLDEQESKHFFCEESSWMHICVAILF